MFIYRRQNFPLCDHPLRKQRRGEEKYSRISDTAIMRIKFVCMTSSVLLAEYRELVNVNILFPASSVKPKTILYVAGCIPSGLIQDYLVHDAIAYLYCSFWWTHALKLNPFVGADLHLLTDSPIYSSG